MSDQEDVKDVKPVTKLRITVTATDGVSLQFVLKPSSKFEKMFNAFEEKRNVQAGTMRFLYNGLRLRPQDSPADHEMEDEDDITAELAQIGGCNRQ